MSHSSLPHQPWNLPQKISYQPKLQIQNPLCQSSDQWYAVIKGAEHEENAKLFVDFIVSPDVQRLAVEKLYRRTVRDDITPDQKEEGSIMDFDLGWAVKNQKSILERWAALMAGNGGGS